MATFTCSIDDAFPDSCLGGVLTIGNFDGVHLGHQALLAEASRQAQAIPGPAVAVTLDPHPSLLLRPDKVGPSLNTLADRVALLNRHGADHVLILRTNADLLQLSAREFFQRIILAQMRAAALVEGFNFGFGRNREGTIDVLKQLCTEAKLRLTLLPPREVQGLVVSSSRVRTELLAGRVDVVAALLGREYVITGTVEAGQKRGTTIGFPTANLHDVPTLLPGDGVYAMRATVDGTTWPAAANVGPNPTFGESARKTEVHLLGFTGDLYGKLLSATFVKKIRDTKKFASIDTLKEQISHDLESVRMALSWSAKYKVQSATDHGPQTTDH